MRPSWLLTPRRGAKRSGKDDQPLPRERLRAPLGTPVISPAPAASSSRPRSPRRAMPSVPWDLPVDMAGVGCARDVARRGALTWRRAWHARERNDAWFGANAIANRQCRRPHDGPALVPVYREPAQQHVHDVGASARWGDTCWIPPYPSTRHASSRARPPSRSTRSSALVACKAGSAWTCATSLTR